MADSKMFRLCPGCTMKSVVLVVEDFLKTTKKMQTQKMDGGNCWIVQGKDEAKWKVATGMSSALQVKISEFGQDTVNVEIGSGKWADKLGAGAVGALVFAPLALTAAFGAWQQKGLAKEVFDRIDAHIFARGEDTPKAPGQIEVENEKNAAIAAGKTICPKCGAFNEKGTKFCSSCGEKLQLPCPKCGAPLALGQKFCPECGAKIGGPKKCPQCGVEAPEGKKFCAECGSPIN